MPRSLGQEHGSAFGLTQGVEFQGPDLTTTPGHLLSLQRSACPSSPQSPLCSAFDILQMLGLVRRQEEPIERKSVWTGWKPQVVFYFCESCASIWKQLKHKGRAKSILSHAKRFIYFIVFELRFATAREHVLITKACPGYCRLYNDLGLCCWKMFLFTPDSMMYQLLHPNPSPNKKPSEPHFLKIGTWSVTPNSK